ncbi:hypothetical protein Tco_1354083 [Tanacetum coccineum]
MESSSSHSEERVLQLMQLKERQLHSDYMAKFKELKIYLEFLRNNRFIVGSIIGLYENAFRIFFQEECETLRVKIYQNLNQLQWKLERKILHSSNQKSCLKVLKTPFKEFFDSKEYLDELDKLIDERVLKYGELRMKEKEVQAMMEIERRLQESEMQKQESLVTEDRVETQFSRSADENRSSDKDSSNSLNECSRSGNENRSSDHESTISGNDADVDIAPLYDSDTVTEVPHSNNDTFENVFAYGIQSHEQPESIPNTYKVNENNSNIISNIPNMDPDRDKEEHDDVDYEQQHALFASLINNLKCDVEKCNKVNRGAQQANFLLTNELKRYKKKEKYFANETTIESEYCKKIKLLNDEISNLKSQACEKDKTFAKENGKFDDYVQPLLNRKNELENKIQEFLKQINDLDNRLRKAGQTDQTLRMLLPKEDNVNTGKQGVGILDLMRQNK